ncbi:MAG: TonB-dependent receptor [Pseudomonadota bacterium]
MVSRHISRLAMLCALCTLPPAAFAQSNQEPVDLGTLVLRGEKIGRVAADASPGTTVIDGEEASSVQNADIDDIIQGQSNVLANEGFRLPSIRGIDSNGGSRPSISAGAQPRIPVLVDDVPLPSNEASNITQTSTFDLDTVEVARGPQATSTGRNTIGGAIRVYTNDPVFEEEGAVRVFVNDQSKAGLAFMLNQPLSDQVAFRFVGEYANGDSYINNTPSPLPSGIDPNHEELTRLRAKLLIEPEEIPGLSLLFSAERSEIEGPTEGFFDGNVDDLSITGGTFGSVSAYEIVDQTTLSARLSYDISDTTTLVARYSMLDNDLLFADSGEVLFGFFNLGATGFDKELSEGEVYLRFQDLGVIERGVLGIIHTKEEELGFNNGTIAFDVTGEIENTALYGEFELSGDRLAEGLTFVLGGRYEEDKRFRQLVDVTGTVSRGDFKESVFLPKIGLRYTLNENTSFGYTYSEGFRGGGLDVDAGAGVFGGAVSAVAFGPETLDQHEIYAKTTTMKGALDLTATAFYYQFNNAQIDGAAVYPASGDPALGNVPEATGKGLELGFEYRTSNGFTFDGALGILDTEITRVGAGQAGFLGLELPRAPNRTASLGVRYAPGSGFFASAQARYVSSHTSAIGQPEIESSTIVDVGGGYEFTLAGGQDVRIEAFVENLFDERHITFSELSGIGTLQKVGRPRTITIAATMRF